MSQQASSVQADRDSLGALASFLATGSAISLCLFPVLIMRESLGTDGVIGWALAAAVTGIAAYMTTRPILHTTRNIVIAVGAVVLPVLLILIGNAAIGGVLLGCGLVGCAIVMPLVEWALGLSEQENVQRSFVLKFSSGREVSNPIPSMLILGVLIFAWPGELLAAGWVAAPFFGFLLMLASLGGMFQRVRESSAGVVSVHPKFMTQWFVAGFLATILCAAIGFILPLSMGNVQGVADRHLGGPVNEGPHATRIDHSKNKQPKPNDEQSPGGLGNQQYDKDLPAPSESISKPPTQEELQNRLIALIALGIVAAIILWLLKKYNRQVLAFLRWLWAAISGPFIRAYNKWVEERKRKKHEAAVRAVLASIEDPFSDPPADLSSEDLRPLYDKLVADLSLLGAKPKSDESATAFVRRVATVYSVDKESLYYLGQVMTEATFSPRPVTPTKLSTARERFVKLRKQIYSSVNPQQLSEKQEAYRWSFAESKLSGDESVSAK